MNPSESMIEQAAQSPNFGGFAAAEAHVGTGVAAARDCGDVMKLQIKVNPDTRVIEDARFNTFKCGSAIASASRATEWLKGKTVEQALERLDNGIHEALSLPPVKVNCSGMTEDAIKFAIADYLKNAAEAAT